MYKYGLVNTRGEFAVRKMQGVWNWEADINQAELWKDSKSAKRQRAYMVDAKEVVRIRLTVDSVVEDLQEDVLKVFTEDGTVLGKSNLHAELDNILKEHAHSHKTLYVSKATRNTSNWEDKDARVKTQEANVYIYDGENSRIGAQFERELHRASGSTKVIEYHMVKRESTFKHLTD